MDKPFRILVVDDNRDRLRIHKKLLQSAGHEVLEAETGSDGLKQAKQCNPDLILLNLILTDISGIEVCRLIKTNPSLSPIYVVMISNQKIVAEDQPTGLEEGADEYITLPITNRELLARIAIFGRLKKSVETIQRQTERLKLSTHAAGVGIWELDIVTDKLVWDDGMCRLYGITPESFKGTYEAWAELVIPEALPRLNREFQMVLKGEREYNTEFRIVWPDKSVHYIKSRAILQRDESGKPIRMLGTNWDFTELATVHEKLNESLRKTDSLINNLSGIVYRCANDSEWTMEYLNEGFTTITGYPVSDFIGNQQRSFNSIVVQEDLQRVWDTIQQALAVKEPWILEYRMYTFWGEVKWVWEKGSGVFNEQGKVIALEGIITDITDRKRAEEELQLNNDRYRQAIEQANAVAYQKDYRTDRYVFISNGIKDITGYTAEELTHEQWNKIHQKSIFYGDAAGLSMNEAALQVQKGKLKNWKVEQQILSKDGKLKWISDTAIQLFDSQDKLTGSLGIIQDITEQKLAEEELQLNHERYRRAISQIGAVPYQRDYLNDNHHAFMGEGIKDITGYAPEELTWDVWKKITLESVLMGECAGLDKKEAGRLTREGKIKNWKVDHRIQRKDGEIRWISDNSVQLTDAQGKIIGSLGIIQDITERKLAEEQLKMNHELYRQAISQANAVPYQRDYDSDRYIFIGEGIKDITGYTPVEMTRTVWDSLIMKCVYESEMASLSTEELIHQIKEGKIKTWKGDYQIRNRYGEIRWLSDTAVQLTNEQGKVSGSLGIIQDITDRKLVEEEIKKAALEIEDLYNAAPCGYHSYDTHGILVRMNGTELSWLGYQREEIIGKKITDILTPISKLRFEETFPVLKERGWVKDIEFELIRKDGSILPVLVSATAMRNSDGHFLMSRSTVYDITERKQLESQLMHSQKMQVVGTLAGGIAHDFNNLMAVVNGYSEVLLDEEELSNSAREAINDIYKAGQRAAELTRQLLMFSRKTEPNFSPCDIHLILDEMESMLQRTLGPSIDIQMNKKAQVSSFIGDFGQIEQAIMNLSVNSRDAMPQGGKLIFTTNNLTVDETYTHHNPNVHIGNYLILSVTDNGVGMDGTTVKRIFEPFFTTKDIGKGTGLGLAMVYGIMNNHQGWVNVTSKPGIGTEISLYIPIKNAKENTLVVEKDISELPHGTETILLVDDDPLVLRMGRTLLAKLGYQVIVCNHAEKGLEIYFSQQSQIQLVITDLLMPDMDGHQFINALQRDGNRVKIIIASGADISLQKVELLDKKIDARINKPFTMNELATKVRYVLDLI